VKEKEREEKRKEKGKRGKGGERGWEVGNRCHAILSFPTLAGIDIICAV